MGSFDGAEICELVELYLLEKLSNVIEKQNIGLYRDDGLGVIGNCTGPKLDRLKKDITAIFKSEELKITIETNLVKTDFLDVNFDLSTGKYFPYRKPNDKPLYINRKSNHPTSILKELPKMINKRISDLSCDKEQFEKAKGIYESALSASGFPSNLTFEDNVSESQRPRRKRKIIWFNPPFNQQVKSNIGKSFLNLVKKHFPKKHKFSKIFNTNTIKLSYSCTTNMENTIKQHNTKILNQTADQIEKLCNCRNKVQCPLEGKCLTKCTVYKATVSAEGNNNTYYGLCEGDFKSRFNNHVKSFKHRKYANETELSKHIWKLKDSDTIYSIKWNIESTSRPYVEGSGRCNLCLAEKVAIVRAEPKGLLNKRTELLSKCRHRNKFLLCNIK